MLIHGGDKGHDAMFMLKAIKTKATRNISSLVKIATVGTRQSEIHQKSIFFVFVMKLLQFITIYGHIDIKLFACFPR